MKGLNIILQSLGIKIDPSEIEEAFNRSKDALPELARAFNLIEKRQQMIEEKLDQIIATQKFLEGVPRQ